MTDAKARIANLQCLLSLVELVPDEWVTESSSTSHSKPQGELVCLPCSSWKVLQNQWRKALYWIDGLDKALSVMIASIISTKTIGDQLWVKIIAPASCGKSTLCEAISTAKDYVYPVSDFTGFHSGYKTDRNGTEDHGLMAKVANKTMVTKDGDTLLKNPSLAHILAQARDMYDGSCHMVYRNGIVRQTTDQRTTWILCGTNGLRELDSSELGERFLDCVIVENMDLDLELAIISRSGYRTGQSTRTITNCDAATHRDPALSLAMQLTGGYINHLCHLLFLPGGSSRYMEMPELSGEQYLLCNRLGALVARLRTRPSKRQNEVQECEIGTRLGNQFIRLAMCLAVVMQTKAVDNIVMKRVYQVAMDTGRGKTLDIVRAMVAIDREVGMTDAGVVLYYNDTGERTKIYLLFLRGRKIVECFKPVLKNGMTGSMRWRLTEPITRLYEMVVSCYG